MATRLSNLLVTVPGRLFANWRMLWRAIRHLSGDDAYERYLKHHADCHAGSAPLSPKEYFVRHQLQKWHGIKRCC